MSEPTLEDARDGLLLYLRNRPNGGTKAELLAMGAARGFEEPLLAVWLDRFLEGMARTRVLGMAGSDYDTDFVPAATSLGDPEAVRDAIISTFNFLIERGRTLDLVRKQDQRQNLIEERNALFSRSTNLEAGIAWVQSNAPTSAAKTEVLSALNGPRSQMQQLLAGLQERIDQLTVELGG